MIKYSLSDDTWSKLELEAIERVIKSNFYTMGKEVKEYEQKFADKFGSKYAIMSNSGSSANLLLISALIYSKRLKPGDEIIVPAVSWSTTFFPLAQHNLKLKFLDINKETLNIDINKLRRAISPNTKAICVVNLLGNPNNFDEILELCEENNLILLEDNCESMGGLYKGKQLGTIGLAGTYSTFYSHHLCTMEGGVTVTNDEELYHYMLSIRAHGWTRNLPKDSKIYKKNDDEFYESFNFIMPGYNLRPLEMEAAIGSVQLEKLNSIIEQRRSNAEYFKQNISQFIDINIQKEIEKSSWFGFAMILDDKYEGKRNELVKIFRNKGIEVRPIVTGNFTRNKAIEYLDYEIFETLENADFIHDNGLFVGNHSQNNINSIDYLMDALEEFEEING
ncbi:MAG: DegT/DnrJ/EryC1/StrS family aminotransferase [Fusobacteriaceae bacterium]|jgi:CDP-6-deoxy-D-xylo-4-hexulose-3-dehydrase|nr:DegT/DnrJ/EryC1/StrS family aminotransferase [Fusobacteriaceae bacterium]